MVVKDYIKNVSIKIFRSRNEVCSITGLFIFINFISLLKNYLKESSDGLKKNNNYYTPKQKLL